jgi:hypothetical protein
MTSTPKSMKKKDSLQGVGKTYRRRLGGKVILPPLHNGKKNFWNGVLTRTMLAQKTKKLECEVKKLKKEKAKQEENSDICVICQEQCLESKENSTPCGHVFHTGCLLGWLKSHNTCPCCRESLYDKPEVPTQNDIEHLVENVLTMHTETDPTNHDEEVTLPTGLLYRLGDEIARLTTEHALDIDLDWFIDFEPEGSEEGEDEEGEEEEEGEEDDVDAETVIVEDDDEQTVEYTTAEMMTILNLQSEMSEEEKVAPPEEHRQYLLNEIDALLDESSSDMELDTPIHTPNNQGTIPNVVFDFTPINMDLLTPVTPEPRWRLAESMIEPSCTMFEYWTDYGDVLRELRARNSFMRAWNGIKNSEEQKEEEQKEQNEVENGAVFSGTGLWV